jgi:hypothetical protein
VLHYSICVAKAPSNVDITCPVCGQIEQASGTVSLRTSVDTNHKIVTSLMYDAVTDHTCAGITPAPLP